MTRYTDINIIKTDYEIVLNLTDILLKLEDDYEKVMAYLIGSTCERLYIGSYSCSRYFMESVEYYRHVFKEVCCENNWKVTLVVPVMAQADWISGKESLKTFIIEEMQDTVLDEIVVNDYGTWRIVEQIINLRNRQNEATRYNRIKVIAGRLFHKNFRDIRYEEYTSTIGIAYSLPMLDTISAVELDITNHDMDCADISDLDNLQIHMHYPYTLATAGYVCEFASAVLPTTLRFRSDTNCHLECRSCYMEIQGDGAVWTQVGRAVYFENPLLVSCNRQIDRYIYWPLKEVFS